MSLHIARGAALALVLLSWHGSSARAMNLFSVAPGVYRGSTPETAEDFDRLKRMGVKTVLNLRRFDRNAIAREQQALAARGIRHVHVPIRYFPRGDNSIDRAVNVLSDTTLHPVYVHCKHGRDRCGTVVGLYKVRHHGWSATAAYSDMRQYGFNERLGGLRRYYWSAAGRMANARVVAQNGRGGNRALAASARGERRGVSGEPLKSTRPSSVATRSTTAAVKPAATKAPAKSTEAKPVASAPLVAEVADATPAAGTAP